jgi:hypothetical protein
MPGLEQPGSVALMQYNESIVALGIPSTNASAAPKPSMVWWTSLKLATKLAVGGMPEGITLTEKLALALAYAKPHIRTKKRPAAE